MIDQDSGGRYIPPTFVESMLITPTGGGELVGGDELADLGCSCKGGADIVGATPLGIL